MKKILTFATAAFVLLSSVLVTAQDFKIKLQEIFGKNNVISLDSSAFKEYYQIKIPQLINHDDPNSAIFSQQVLLGIADPAAPTVMQTEGYAIPKNYNDPHYKTELTTLLNANQILVEHRFFGESIPDPNSKKFLTYEQAARDHHQITEKLKILLTGKWLSTGVSKSGDAALAYRFFYPSDVDATVAYGISLTTHQEEPGIEKFINEKMKTSDGQKIQKIQLHLLQNKTKFLPVFKKIMTFNNKDISGWDAEVLYDYNVLDLQNSFWQYYKSYDDLVAEINFIVDEELKRDGFTIDIPMEKIEDRMLFFATFMGMGSTDEKMKSHYYQAFSQGGYYGYDETPFRKYLKLKDYPLNIFAGEHTIFKKEFREAEKKWTETEMEKVIFINGSNDPWAVAKIVPNPKKDNLQIIIKDANHTLKIKDLPAEDYKSVVNKLNKWLDLKPEINSQK